MNQAVEKESHAVSAFKLNQLVIRKRVAKVYNLKPSSVLVLMGLVDCYNEKNGIVFPSIRYLQECMNISSDSTVLLAIKELVAKRLIIKSKGRVKKSQYQHNIYAFTRVFFEFLYSDDAIEPPMNFIESARDIQSKPHVNITTKNKREMEKEKEASFLKNLSEFQMRYIDVFKKLSESEMQEYKKLQGFDKEPWLIGKRRAFKEKEKSIAQRKLFKEYEENASCPLDWSKDEQLEYYKGLPPILKNSYYAKAIREKWGLE